MRGVEIRRRFLEFFRGKDHAIVPSDSLVPAKDPTLLFTGAGMNQFKEYFLGTRRDMKRAASCQKCFRTGDVEQVGRTPGHLTFFEMLGNFSFGDYFKREACAWAWEFLTRDLKLPPERLWTSIYESDEEAHEIWSRQVGVAAERIVRFGAKENFWPSNAPTEGPNGPCGPCSEVYYDYQRCTIGKTCPDPERCAPGCPCGRFAEVWNLVFTQFDRQPDGTLTPLPAKNIDTGMGLERLAAVMQDRMSVFETDLFEPIIEAAVRVLREQAPGVLKTDQRPHVYAIADHVRALTFLIADGVVPSNEGRGYVLRMLLRKGARAGRAIGFPGPFLHALVPAVARVMEEPYPELARKRESIAKVILSEEERFAATLEEKVPLLRAELAGIRAGAARLPAQRAAQFYDTHGLSFEEIEQACGEAGVLAPTRSEFDEALAALQSESKAKSRFEGAIFARDRLAEVVAGVAPSRFIGYGPAPTGPAKVLALVQEYRAVQEAKAPASVEVVLDRTPFYGEAGGQVGDTGVLEGAEGKLVVRDTQWVGSALVHRAELTEGRARVGDPVTARVDAARRRRVARNHTGTHLLHASLRRVLGEHVMQAGSLVAPDHLRFDFSHERALSPSERRSVQELVGEWVERALPVTAKEQTLEEAKAAGAIALFGEKYGQRVRVVSIGDVSKELCGGTHLASSREIGLLTVVEEGSVAAGMRRIEALTGEAALARLEEQASELGEIARRLRVPVEEVPQVLDRMLKRTRELEEALERLRVQEARSVAGRLTGEKVAGVTLFAERIPGRLDHAALRSVADAIRSREPAAVVFLADAQGFCVAATADGGRAGGVEARALLRVATEVAGGSGGGRPELAQGKLAQPERFPQVRERLRAWLQERANPP